MPDKFKNGETQDSPLDGVYSSECKERIVRFFLLLAELPVEETYAPEAPSPDDLSASDEGE